MKNFLRKNIYMTYDVGHTKGSSLNHVATKGEGDYENDCLRGMGVGGQNFQKIDRTV